MAIRDLLALHVGLQARGNVADKPYHSGGLNELFLISRRMACIWRGTINQMY